MTRVPKHIERSPLEHFVWAEDGDYKGPEAAVYADKDWLYVVTDDYEGHAMMNIETLPALIKALQRIKSELAAKAKRK
jgi:hypothetical protein